METPLRRRRAGLRGAAILVVERHPAVRSSLCDLLQSGIHGCRVYEAMDEDGAISLAATAPPDGVVVDMEAVAADPRGALRRMHAAFPCAPLIVLSSAGDDELRRVAMDAGAAGYVARERAADDLVGAMRSLLGARRLEV